jgi:DNA-binding response OmpR family regulator
MVRGDMSGRDDVNVLVVDDSVDLAEGIGALLNSKGYAVRTATDGLAALALIGQETPHCVILDVRMPNMDRYEFARHLRAQYRNDIVLIAMSGHATTEPEVLATFSIVDHYLRKPLDFGELDKILPLLD